MKTMIDLYKEVGPQGWPDDPPDKNEPNAELIEELENFLAEIDEELEEIEAAREDLYDREDELIKKSRVYEKRLKALKG